MKRYLALALTAVILMSCLTGCIKVKIVLEDENSKQNSTSVISSKNAKSQEFDERKEEDASKIEKIIIDSTIANINVSVSDSSKVEAHFYGHANVDGDIKFDVSVADDELEIVLNFTGTCYNSNLNLDITVPEKKFKTITARSASADITLSEGLLADSLEVDTQSGNLKNNASFTSGFVTTMSGDVKLYIEAEESSSLEVSTMSGDVELHIEAEGNTSLKVSTMSGNVTTEFENVGYIALSTSSMSGDVRNKHNSQTGYTAKVDISTMSGDITIR